MNYAFQIGSAGVISAMYRQDVASNNLANVQTVGFKPDEAFTIPRRAAREEDNLYSLPSNQMLERLGAGVLLAPNRTNFRQGTVTQSKNPFDLAIQGDGFLTVSVSGSTAGDNVRLTRDGRLTLDKQGRLIGASTGHPVLDDGGRQITLRRDQAVEIDADGTIRQGNSPVAKLGFIDVPDRTALRKAGENLYTAPPAAISSKAQPTGSIVQYAVEESAVDPIRAMMSVQSAANQVGTTVRVMQIADEMMSRAISTLGRVTA